MKYYILLLSIAFSILLTSCQKQGYHISGDIENAENLTVYFDLVDPIENVNSIQAKGESSGSGSFDILLETPPAPGSYRVRIGAKSAYLLLDGTETSVNITGDINTLSKFEYTVDGSPATAEYVSRMKSYVSGETKIKEVQSYILNEASGMTAMMMALQLFGGSVDFAQLHEKVSQKLSQSHPDANFTGQYKTLASAMKKEYLRKMATEKVKIGELAPDITLPDLNGKERSLSELKGQIVLLDFWASWCGPCRRENPNVVRIYDKYKKQGFTVFSVSLDGLDDRTKRRFAPEQLDNQMRSQKQRWQAAINKDNLKWDTHVSDLKKWDSAAAALYGVRSIPRTFLLDREGKIAYINPRQNLEQALQALL